MKQLILFLLLFFGLVPIVKAQDKIITKDGNVINGWNVEIGESSIFYKPNNSANATIKSIAKDDVLIIKKHDGTTLDLYLQNENNSSVSTSSKPTKDQLLPEPSAEIQKQNIDQINSVNMMEVPYAGGKTDKTAERVLCVMGIGQNSQMVGPALNLTPHIGRYDMSNSDVKGKLGERIKNNTVNERNGVIYRDYLSFASNPALAVSIKNKTSKTIFIDLANSFITRGEESSAYYVPQSTTSSTGSSSGIGVNMGAVAGALGVGGAAGTLANGVNVGGGKGKGTATTTYAQRVLAIPPMSSKTLEPQLLFVKLGTFCKGLEIDESNSLNWTPEFALPCEKDKEYKNGEEHNYEEVTSPIKFSVYITYSTSETFEQTENARLDLYLRKIVGFPKTGLVKYAINLSKNFPKFDDEGLYFAGNIMDKFTQKIIFRKEWQSNWFTLQ